MNIQKESSNSLRVELSAQELMEFDLSYEQLNYREKKTKNLFRKILEGAEKITGFSYTRSKLLIEVFPAPQRGCTVFFTRLSSGKRYRQLAPQVFAFPSSESMLSGLETLKATPHVKSELYYWNHRYLLILKEPVPHALSEYGDPLPAGRLTLSCIREHGQMLAAPYAVHTVLIKP